jgi:hypothetical protein
MPAHADIAPVTSRTTTASPRRIDVAVVGAGFGGM